MFITLLIVSFLISLAVSLIVSLMFSKPIDRILHRIIADTISSAWRTYLTFAIYVVGISSGVRIWELERYIAPRTKDEVPMVLNTDRWILEIYHAIVGSLQGIAWMLLVFFLIAMVAYVIMRFIEMKRPA